MNWTRTICSVFRTLLLGALSRTYLLQTDSYDVSIAPRHLSVLPTVVFHPCCRLQSSHRLEVPPVRLSTVYKRAFPVSGATVWNNLQAASARRICAVTRSFQTTKQDLSVFQFLPWHYHTTRVL